MSCRCRMRKYCLGIAYLSFMKVFCMLEEVFSAVPCCWVAVAQHLQVPAPGSAVLMHRTAVSVETCQEVFCLADYVALDWEAAELNMQGLNFRIWFRILHQISLL